MLRAMYAKFSQNTDLRNLLLATNNAKLMLSNQGNLTFSENLVYIRNKLRD
jgi:predicted NAD-dependent protein-ADP-ribosyltransferase YbiA (DUF1768 family)